MTTRTVTVVGAGMVGMSVAWYLQEAGVGVTVLDTMDVAAGSSRGNAGWVAPALTGPLNHPSLLASGIKAALSPQSAVYIPPTLNPRLIRFLGQFMKNSTQSKFDAALRVFIEASRQSVRAFEHMVETGVQARVRDADPLLAAFSSDRGLTHTVAELDHVRSMGGSVDYQVVSREAAMAAEPGLGTGVRSAVSIAGQRFIDPKEFVHALAAAVIARGGVVRPGSEATEVQQSAGAATARLANGDSVTSDAVVLATGAGLNRLSARHGVSTIVQAGRGYSFTVEPGTMPSGPLYFPEQRVACTPLAQGLRVAGMMEFKRPEAPLDQRRVQAIVRAARPMLGEVDWNQRRDEWVGSRPCTADGLPLVGRTRDSRVYVAGGHGMWGIALGPLTGKLLAEQIVRGATDPLLSAFSPMR